MEIFAVKTSLKSVLLASLFAFASVAIAGSPAADPVVGTWTLNVAKSKFSPGPGPKSQTRTYAQTPQGTSVSWKSVGADGKETAAQATFKADGKDYAMTGSPDFDMISAQQVDSHTLKSVQKKGGKAMGKTTRVVSKDGKTLTLSSTGTSANGAPFDNVMVFDRN